MMSEVMYCESLRFPLLRMMRRYIVKLGEGRYDIERRVPGSI
jgi:hypothetical protein